jgi:hypothetical protein
MGGPPARSYATAKSRHSKRGDGFLLLDDYLFQIPGLLDIVRQNLLNDCCVG